MRLVSDYNIIIRDQIFETTCELQGEVKITLREKLEEKVWLLKVTGHQLELIDD